MYAVFDRPGAVPTPDHPAGVTHEDCVSFTASLEPSSMSRTLCRVAGMFSRFHRPGLIVS